MDEKEIQKLLEGIAEKNRAAIKLEIDAAVTGLMTAKQLEEKFVAMGLNDGAIKELTEAVEKQGEFINKVLNPVGEEKSLDQIMVENNKAIKAIAEGGKTSDRNVKIHIPGGRQTKTQVARSAVSGSTMAMRLPDVGQLPYLGTVMSNLFRHAPVSPSSNGVIRYYDQAAITRNAAFVAEGGTKPESVISWIERLLPIEKLADSIPVTKEAFNDVYFIQSEIQRLLDINLALKEDDALWDGDGVTPNIKGVYTSAGAFVTTPYNDSVEAANIYDLATVLRVDISNNRQAKYSANIILMNPIDTLRYKLAKASNGHYLLPPFISADGRFIDGAEVIESSQVTANTMLVGDFRFGTIYDLEGITIEMGWINDQFVKNAFTILAEKREALLIRTVDETAFRKVTDITAALAALETP